MAKELTQSQAELAEIARQGTQAENNIEVGDHKALTLNGTVGTAALNNYTTYATVMGFDHNKEKEIVGYPHAITFGLFADGTGKQLALVDGRISVDMSTLPGWANLASGSHTLTIKAKADGYATSDASTGVTFTKAGAGYTLTVTAFRGSFNITYANGSTADVEDGVYSNVKQINSYVFRDEGDRSWNINGSQPALPYVLTADSTAYVYSACIIEGTLVTLADGTAKPIENITYDDDLLVWNFYEGKFDHAKPIWVKPAGVVPEYNLCKFDNGAEIGLVGPGIYHRIYNNEAHAFTHTGSDDTPIGTTTFTDYGDFTKLVSQEIVHKTVRYYNVITDKHYNIFANGILTSSRISNRYGIESDMRYNLNDVRMTESEVEDYIAKLPR